MARRTRPRDRLRPALAAVAVLAAACNPFARRTPERPVPAVYEQGVASWYGPGFAGRRTASGEVFDPDALTAAHRRLPFGTRVRVVNLDNGRDVVVRINDRGPWIAGRIIDLSHAAARLLGMVRAGTARVQLFLVRAGSPVPDAGPEPGTGAARP